MHFLMWHERANWKINMMKKHWLIDWNASYVIGQNVKLKCKHGPFIDQVWIVSLVPSVNIWDVRRANWRANYDTKELIGCKNQKIKIKLRK
jgi:hypothetical protein